MACLADRSLPVSDDQIISRKGTNGVSTDGVTANFMVLFYHGVLP